MQDGTALPVSRRRWIEVAALLQQHRAAADAAQPAGPAPGTEPAAGPTKPVEPAMRPIIAIAAEEALLLMRSVMASFEPKYALQGMTTGTALPEWLLLNPTSTWPALIVLDARTNQTDRLVALRTLKRHERLRAIPVVWLVAPGNETTRPYLLQANSVVVVRSEPAQFTATLERLCRYWLSIVRLPLSANL